MIINEIDENNEKNNRTIDTKTGIYLKATTFNLRESMFSFMVYDGETLIGIRTLMDFFIDEKKKISTVNYNIDGIIFEGEARNKDYITVIKKLLTKCGKRFRSSERLFNYTEYVEVKFEPKALKQLKAWEKDNA